MILCSKDMLKNEKGVMNMGMKNKDLAMHNKVQKMNVQHDLNKDNNKPGSKQNVSKEVLEDK